jgi:hypothetical protein
MYALNNGKGILGFGKSRAESGGLQGMGQFQQE